MSIPKHTTMEKLKLNFARGTVTAKLQAVCSELWDASGFFILRRCFMISEKNIKEKEFSWPLVSIIGRIYIIQCWKHELLEDGDEIKELDFSIDDILEEIIEDLRIIKNTLYGSDVK
jgi:hypothetical protein